MTQTGSVRRIDVGVVPERFARGWHYLGLVERFADGRPHAVEAYGTKLVVFQSSDGRLRVLDAYCRHMGGHLSQGEVKGDAVACPFHDWRWGGVWRCRMRGGCRCGRGPGRGRRWRNKQLFHVDTADVTDDMTRRFEYEVDTARATQVWDQEVADNLARQHQADAGV